MSTFVNTNWGVAVRRGSWKPTPAGPALDTAGSHMRRRSFAYDQTVPPGAGKRNASASAAVKVMCARCSAIEIPSQRAGQRVRGEVTSFGCLPQTLEVGLATGSYGKRMLFMSLGLCRDC